MFVVSFLLVSFFLWNVVGSCKKKYGKSAMYLFFAFFCFSLSFFVFSREKFQNSIRCENLKNRYYFLRDYKPLQSYKLFLFFNFIKKLCLAKSDMKIAKSTKMDFIILFPCGLHIFSLKSHSRHDSFTHHVFSMLMRVQRLMEYSVVLRRLLRSWTTRYQVFNYFFSIKNSKFKTVSSRVVIL